MAQIDFSLQNRIPDGNGKLLVGDLSPTDGSYTTEQQYLEWMKGKILYSGYLYNGDFYKESAHTNVISKVDGAMYVDLSDGSNLSLYYCDNTTYKALTEEAQVQAIIDGLNDGTIVPLKAKQDQNGNVIDQTYETKADASDLKSAIQGNTARIENLEQEHGGYVPVNYRGTNDVPTGKAKYALVESIVGKSRAWNQLVSLASVATSSMSGATVNASTQTASGTVSNADGSFYLNMSNATNFDIVSGHKYLFVIPISAPSALTAIRAYISNSIVTNVAIEIVLSISNGLAVGIATALGTKSVQCLCIYSSTTSSAVSGQTITIAKPFVRELDTIFPEGVPSTVAECVQKCPDLLTYDAFGTSIVDTTVEGVRSTTDITQPLTQTTADGSYDPVTDQYQSTTRTGANAWACKVNVSNASEITMAYDYAYIADIGYGFSNDDVFGSADIIGKCTSTLSASPTTAQTGGKTYLYFYFRTLANGMTATLRGLKLYVGDSLATDSLTLPTSVTLRSAGSVAEVYDLETGKKTNPIGEMVYDGSDDENWSPYGNTTFFIVPSVAFKGASSTATKANISSNRLISVARDNIYNAPLTICTESTYFMIDFPSTVTDVATLRTWLASNPLTIVYELATPNDPTQLTPVIDNTIQTEGGGTIETIQTQTPVIDNSMDVGYLAL